MFGAAIARHLAPYAKVTVAGPDARADGPGGYGAHHDEGRIIGDLSRDPVWSELNRRARDGMTELDPTLITSGGALTATTRDGPGYLSVAAQLREHRSEIAASCGSLSRCAGLADHHAVGRRSGGSDAGAGIRAHVDERHGGLRGIRELEVTEA